MRGKQIIKYACVFRWFLESEDVVEGGFCSIEKENNSKMLLGVPVFIPDCLEQRLLGTQATVHTKYLEEGMRVCTC